MCLWVRVQMRPCVPVQAGSKLLANLQVQGLKSGNHPGRVLIGPGAALLRIVRIARGGRDIHITRPGT